ncbi:MAG: glycyl-radical enzyme activating protein, partial [Thermodesulfobacteriota bacterium]
LKIMDEKAHRRETGVSNRLILENLKRLDQAGKKVWIRMPIIPGVTDLPENLSSVARFMASLEKIWYIVLLPYHETGLDKYRLLGKECRMPETKRPTPERLVEIAKLFESHGLTAAIGS